MNEEEIKPGQFFTKKSKIENLFRRAKRKPQLEFGRDLIALYTYFRDKIYNPSSVIYPSCGYDASPSKVFSNVTFVDLEKGNEGCIEALKNEGLKAIKADIREYIPKENHDLLILLNPSIPSKWATKHLMTEGWVIANDYHGSASQLYSEGDFSLWGTLNFVERDRRKEDYRVEMSNNLEGLFEPVENLEEFKRLRPKEYEFTKTLVGIWESTGAVKINPEAPFEEKFKEYIADEYKGRMPSKRIADRYLFLKK